MFGVKPLLEVHWAGRGKVEAVEMVRVVVVGFCGGLISYGERSGVAEGGKGALYWCSSGKKAGTAA